MPRLLAGLLRLPREIGLKAAMPLILTGQPVSAEEGHRLGFVSEIAEPGQELERAGGTGRRDLRLRPGSGSRRQAGRHAWCRGANRGGDERAIQMARRYGNARLARLYRRAPLLRRKTPASLDRLLSDQSSGHSMNTLCIAATPPVRQDGCVPGFNLKLGMRSIHSSAMMRISARAR